MRKLTHVLMMGARTLALTLAFLGLLSCTKDAPPEPTSPEQLPPGAGVVRGVLIAAYPTTLAPGETTRLLAFVEGFGLKTRDVTWTLQGPGQLGFGGYTADPSFTGTVTVVATSKEDPRVSATLQLTVAQPATRELKFLAIDKPVCPTLSYCLTILKGESTFIQVQVESTYEVVSVVTRVDGAEGQTSLSRAADYKGPGLYEGNLDLRGVGRGSHRLEVTVTDSRGNTLVTPSQIVVDRPARFRVEAPLSGRLAVVDSMAVNVACIDDTPDCDLTLNVTKKDPQAAAKVLGGRLDTVVDLRDFPNQSQVVELVALDALGQRSAKQFNVTVVPDPALQKVASVPGTLVEADAARLLYLPSDTPDGQPQPGFTFRDRASGADNYVRMPPDLWLKDPYSALGFSHLPRLTTSGAAFLARPAGGTKDNLYAYRTDPAELLTLEQDVSSFEVGGDFVLWDTYRPDPQVQYHLLHNLWLRNLASGTTLDLGDRNADEVLPDGTVVSTDEDKDIVVFKDGAWQKVIASPDPVIDGAPRTDGNCIAFTRRSGTTGPTALMLWTGEELETLSADWPGVSTQAIGYALRGGWVAYADRGPGGVTQVWLRSPDGVKRKVTDFSEESVIVALGDGGRVAVRTGWSRLSVTRADGTLQELGLVPGEPVWLDGAWHLLVADSLFRVK